MMIMMLTTMTMINMTMRMVELTLVQNISAWSDQFPSHVTSPVYIQTLHQEDRDTPAQTGTRSRTSSVGSSSHWGTGLGRLNLPLRTNQLQPENEICDGL